MSQQSPTPSEILRDELLDAMGNERGKLPSGPVMETLMAGQTAGVWFSNNRDRRIAVVELEPGTLQVVIDYEPKRPHVASYLPSPRTPPYSVQEAADFVLTWLFGTGS